MTKFLAALGLAVCLSLTSLSAVPIVRTIYVTITDKDGAKVPGLTAADFAVKEGGKAVEITKVEPATGRMHMALLVEERLSPDATIRQAVFDFMKRVQPAAEISLVSVGLSNRTIVPYTQSMDALVGALNQLPVIQQPTANLLEGLIQVGKEYEKQPPDRPVIVAVAMSSGPNEASADEVNS